MAVIKPFKGIRYNKEKIGDLSKVITPPYDVIDAKSQDIFYRRHPNNIIRLEYGKVYCGDGSKNNRYTRAATEFNSWLKSKILVQDKKPALYFYEQEFTCQGRTSRRGFIAAVKLEEYEKKVILPHEDTMPGHKTDRLALLSACKASFSPIFGLYNDPERKVEKLFEDAIEADNVTGACITDEQGQIHRLWIITDLELISKVQKEMQDKRIFIADGHHRYETALTYRNQQRLLQAKNKIASSGNAPYEYTMMTLVNLYNPGLVILPTHRLIKNAQDEPASKNSEKNTYDRLPNLLKEDFEVQKYPLEKNKSNLASFIEMMSRYGQEDAVPSGRHSKETMKRPAFGLYLGDNRLYLLKLKKDAQLHEAMPKEKSKAWQNLDVSILHTSIFEKYLGIDKEEVARGEKLVYTRKAEEALEAVDRGDCRAAFLVNATRVNEVIKIAENGEKMPQKSTYFYPKLVAGLVIYSLESSL